MRSITSSSPATLVYVAFIPAKEVPAVSSDVAEERTTTRAPGPSEW